MNSKSKYKYLSEIISIGKGKRPKYYYSSPHMSSIPYILIENFDGKYTQYVDKEDMTICNPNDILIVWDGARAGLSSFGHKGAIGSTIAKLYIKHPSEILPKFVYFFIQGKYEVLNRNTHGAAVPHLTKNYLENLNVPILSKKVQELMVSSLETCESAIQKRKEANRLTDEFLKSTFLEMFGDPIKNNRNLKKQTIESLASKERHAIKRGPFGGSLRKEIFVKSGYKVYEQKHVIKNDFKIGTYYINKDKFQEMKPFAIQPDDILISCSGTIGKLAIVPEDVEEGIINQALLKITLDKTKAFPIYFKYLFESESLQKYLFGYTHGSAMKNVKSVSNLKAIELPIASIKQQQKFADIVRKVEKLKQKQHESEKELTNLFNSLMQKAFRGKL